MQLSLFRLSLVLALSGIFFQFNSNAASSAIAAVTASPVAGNTPLAVFFDGRGSVGASSYFWDFGDGLTSSDPTVTHIYTVSGTYTASLVVSDALGNPSAPAQVSVTVNGPGVGVVTPHMNFRIAPFQASFKISRTVINADTFSMRGAFNSVDLPSNLHNVAMSVALNGHIIFTGLIDQNFEVNNPKNLTKPTYFAFINIRDQLLNIDVKKASLATIFAQTGATDENIPAGSPKKVPVTVTVTIGAQTYTFTQIFYYSATQGSQGSGQFNLQKRKGDVGDGFFVLSQVSAIEVAGEQAHFFDFAGYISEPTGFLPENSNLLVPPTTGNVTVTLNQADKIVIPFDRFVQTGSKLTYLQPNRQLGGLRTISIDPVTRLIGFSSWDIKAVVSAGGTGLPLIGQAFTTFDFTVRLDIDQPSTAGVKTLSVVTATRLSRKSLDDAFWQTGRKITRK